MQSYLTQRVVTILAVRSFRQTTWEKIWSSSCCVISLYQHHKSRAVAQSPSCLSHKIDSPKKSQVVVYTHNTDPWRLNLGQRAEVSSLSETLFFLSFLPNSGLPAPIALNTLILRLQKCIRVAIHLRVYRLHVLFHPWTQTIYYLRSRSKMEFSERLNA